MPIIHIQSFTMHIKILYCLNRIAAPGISKSESQNKTMKIFMNYSTAPRIGKTKQLLFNYTEFHERQAFYYIA